LIKIKYIIFERYVFQNKRGGFSHIENVGRVLKNFFYVQIIGRNFDEKFANIDAVFYNNRLSFFKVLLNILVDFKSSFLIRKYFSALPFLFLIIILKKVIKKRQKHYIEINGVSGDFLLKSKTLGHLFLLVNILLLTVYDGIYVVNNNLRRRLLFLKILNPERIIVCSNGGLSSPIIVNGKNLEHRMLNETNLVYFGDNQPHYHIDEFISSLQLMGSFKKNLNVIIIGEGYYNAYPDFVKVYARKTLSELFDFISELNGFNFGLLPLSENSLTSQNDVSPIKYFDYLYCGLPVISSSNCLGSIENRDHIFTYDQISNESLYRTLCKVDNLNLDSYIGCQESAVTVSILYTWDNTLSGLVEMVSKS